MSTKEQLLLAYCRKAGIHVIEVEWLLLLVSKIELVLEKGCAVCDEKLFHHPEATLGKCSIPCDTSKLAERRAWIETRQT